MSFFAFLLFLFGFCLINWVEELRLKLGCEVGGYSLRIAMSFSMTFSRRFSIPPMGPSTLTISRRLFRSDLFIVRVSRVDAMRMAMKNITPMPSRM